MRNLQALPFSFRQPLVICDLDNEGSYFRTKPHLELFGCRSGVFNCIVKNGCSEHAHILDAPEAR